MKKNKFIKWLIPSILLLLGIGVIILAFLLDYHAEVKAMWYIYVLYICGAIALFVSFFLIRHNIAQNNEKIHSLSVKEITMIGVQSAITIILYYFVKINVPFFPSWLDLQVSEIPALITSFAYGPYAGSIVILVRFITKLPGTMTLGVGEIADLIFGLALVIISGIIYKKNKTLKGALIGLGIGMGVSTVLACILNWCMLIPAYLYIANFPMESLVEGMSYIGGVNANNFMTYYILIGVLPFNIFRYIIVYILTFLLYKKIHRLLNRLTK